MKKAGKDTKFKERRQREGKWWIIKVRGEDGELDQVEGEGPGGEHKGSSAHLVPSTAYQIA